MQQFSNLTQGARVVVNIYGVHQNPDLWPEPLNVLDARWLQIFMLCRKRLFALYHRCNVYASTQILQFNPDRSASIFAEEEQKFQ